MAQEQLALLGGDAETGGYNSFFSSQENTE